jgi:type III secretion system chaperone SycN
MNGLDDTLRAFGAGIGMPGLALGAGGNVALELASGRRVAIEPAGDEVLVYVSDPAPHDAAEQLLRAWRRAHHSRLDGLAVQAALREQDGMPRLLAVVRLASGHIDAGELMQTVETLSRWLDAARDD